MFNDSIKKSFTLSLYFCSTDRKTVHTQLEYQVDIVFAQNINSPRYLIVANQTVARVGVPNKAKSIAILINLNRRKYHVDVDGGR